MNIVENAMHNKCCKEAGHSWPQLEPALMVTKVSLLMSATLWPSVVDGSAACISLKIMSNTNCFLL